MHVVQELKKDLYYIGCSDKNLKFFENSVRLKDGISYNSYLYKGKVNILLDTADVSVIDDYTANLDAVLDGEKLDYIIVQHMEPDHSSSLRFVVRSFPNVKIICTMMASNMVRQFCDFDMEDRFIIVKENEELELGDNKFRFIMAPNVHWPEVMFTYDIKNKVLFSADAFGGFGAINGCIVDDNIDFNDEVVKEYRRYYTNIIGRFGDFVIRALDKIKDLEIDMVCPLHSYVLKKHIPEMLDKYNKWASYSPEDDGILIVYGSVYGNTEAVAKYMAKAIQGRGFSNVRIYDANKTADADLVAESNRCKTIILASITFNGGLFPPMRNYLHLLAEHNFRNRDVYLIQNGSWGPNSARSIKEILSDMKDMRVNDKIITFKSRAGSDTMKEVDDLVEELLNK